MKVSLYMAVSIDGFIATHADDSSWVSENDWPIFQKFIKENDAILMGRKTYEKGIEEKVFPYEGALNVVVTSNNELLGKISNSNDLFVDKKPKELIEYLKGKRYKKVGIIGGGRFNGSMLGEGLIDEIIISVHPIILGSGIKLFEDFEGQVRLEKIEVKEAHELVWIKYRVIKGY